MNLKSNNRDLLPLADQFVHRHIGPRPHDIKKMLGDLGLASLDRLIEQTVPAQIQLKSPLNLPPPRSETDVLTEIRTLADQNKLFRSFIGMGYNNTITPAVILRNVLENPGWYTQYTPYQAEIAQGRLEALLNFQTMIVDLTGMEIANSSMLDEGTSAAEAMTMAHRARPRKSTANSFFVSELCHPQTIELVQTRAEPFAIEVVVGDHRTVELTEDYFGVLLQYPATGGQIIDYADFCRQAHALNALVTVCADLLALVLLKSPGEFGADIVVGNSQRFGVPMGYGGPHAAFMATKHKYERIMPGRLVGVSQDAEGHPALRLALQTREQHIRRERATSNICTAQVLLAIVASMYAVYHGPEGLRRIAQRVQLLTAILQQGLRDLGHEVCGAPAFDTLAVKVEGGNAGIQAKALAHHVNLRYYENGAIGITLDETCTVDDLQILFTIFGATQPIDIAQMADAISLDYGDFARTDEILTHPVFNSYRSETEMLRYITKLESRDLSLAHSMISLGSCTMKLNATTEMIPITWQKFGGLHPFVPVDQAEGYAELFTRLEASLAEITGFHAVSLQPNAGSQGEYSGLLTIRAYHHARGDNHRNICLIPTSAHGTNPASAVMAGMKVVAVKSDEDGSIDVADLRVKAEKHAGNLSALMVTYPSTHGVFESAISEICQIVHEYGGQVYLDGANMNAQVGLCRPGDYGADVCHLNLHKTFLYSTWWRWSRYGTDLCGRAFGSLFAGTSCCTKCGWRARDQLNLFCPVG